MMGVGGKIEGRMSKICDFFGEISYPIYIVHYPFIYWHIAWVNAHKSTPEQYIPVAVALFFWIMLLSYGALKLYDLPVRKWLKEKLF
jgi:peptidoglycan/LPS O-acetylase OafA/YrhL